MDKKNEGILGEDIIYRASLMVMKHKKPLNAAGSALEDSDIEVFFAEEDGSGKVYRDYFTLEQVFLLPVGTIVDFVLVKHQEKE